MATFLNISAKDGTQHLIFIDKISNVYRDQQGNTVIVMVNGNNIVTRFSFEELIRMIDEKRKQQ